MMSASQNLAALQRAVERFDEGDLDGYMRLYHPDVVFHGAAPQPLIGKAVQGFYRAIFAAFSDLRLQAEDVICQEDKLVCRYTMRGRHTGEFLGAQPSDRPFAVAGITIMTFVDELCVERWSCLDNLGLLIQIGAFPSPQPV